MSREISSSLWSRTKAMAHLPSFFRKVRQKKIGVVLLLCAMGAAAIWAAVSSWRYETHPLSKNTYLVEDRLLGSVYYCHIASCRPAEIRDAPKPPIQGANAGPAPNPKTLEDLNELSDAAASPSGEDWSRFNDDQFVEEMLEQSLDDFANSAKGSTQQGRE